MATKELTRCIFEITLEEIHSAARRTEEAAGTREHTVEATSTVTVFFTGVTAILFSGLR